jgi:hypothetical protein
MNMLPLAAQVLASQDAVALGKAARKNCPVDSIDVVLSWHGLYVVEARAVAARGVAALTGMAPDVLAVARAYVRLVQMGAELDAILVCNPRFTLRGTARMFYDNGATEDELASYLRQLAAWEEAWIEAFSGTPDDRN